MSSGTKQRRVGIIIIIVPLGDCCCWWVFSVDPTTSTLAYYRVPKKLRLRVCVRSVDNDIENNSALQAAAALHQLYSPRD